VLGLRSVLLDEGRHRQPAAGIAARLFASGGAGLGLALAGAVLTTCVVLWAIRGSQTGRIGSHLALYGAAFLAYLVALVAARGLSSRGVFFALSLALGWRALLVAAPPLLSDDVNRAVWEGRIQVHGGNPYAWRDRPEAPKWEALRDEVWHGLNHRDYTAVYPPLWQLAARAVVSLHDSVTAMKAFLVACEALALAALVPLLKRRGLPLSRLLIAAWSPLALVEVAGSGHNEAFGLLWLTLGLLALEAGWPLLSALAAALGFQSKLLPGLVAVAWTRRYRAWHVMAAALAAAALVLPYRGAGPLLWSSLDKYASFWRFNETLFAPLALAVGSHRAAVALAALLVLALAVGLAVRGADAVAAATAVVAVSLLLSPNVLPWYALWFLPLLALRDEPAALLFTGTVALAYLVYPDWQSGRPWYLDWGVRALEYLPCVAVLAGPWLRPGAWYAAEAR